MPTWNQGQYIRESIESVLAQTYTDFELIIVDDGSTDDTPSILESYTCDPRVRIIRKDNGGTGSALNAGFAVANGEYETHLNEEINNVYSANKNGGRQTGRRGFCVAQLD
jgi:glycosyltransferase involved in cell wall biosynthesis